MGLPQVFATVRCIVYDSVCSVCKRTTKEEEDCLVTLATRMLIMVFIPFFAANPLSWSVGYCIFFLLYFCFLVPF